MKVDSNKDMEENMTRKKPSTARFIKVDQLRET